MLHRILPILKQSPFLPKFLPTPLSILIKYNYHLTDMLKRGKVQNKLKLYSPALHLYIDKILRTNTFNQLQTILVMLQMQKIRIDPQLSNKLFRYAYKNINEIESIDSIANILGTMYQLGYQCKNNNNNNKGESNQNPDRTMILQFGTRGFQIIKKFRQNNINQSYSLYIIRILISLHQLIGINSFQQQDFQLIPYQTFKPLFITFLLQILYKQNLQQKFKITQQIMDFLYENKNFIPFSDVHHMRRLIKIIRSQKYMEIMEYLDVKLKSNITKDHISNNNNIGTNQNDNIDSNNTRSSNNNKQSQNITIKLQKQQGISPSIVQNMYDSYLDDLYKKYI